MKIEIGQRGIYYLRDTALWFKDFRSNNTTKIQTGDEFLTVVKGEGNNSKDYCFTASKFTVSLWNFDQQSYISTFCVDLGEIIEIGSANGYLVVFLDKPCRYQLYSADPFELIQECVSEAQMFLTISQEIQPVKSQIAQIERLKLRHQGEIFRFQEEIADLKKQGDQFERELVESKIAIKQLMSELVRDKKVDAEDLVERITNATLKRRNSVSQKPGLRNSWSIPFLGISINSISEAKED